MKTSSLWIFKRIINHSEIGMISGPQLNAIINGGPTLYHRSYNLVTIRVMSHQVALGESSLAMVVTHENQGK